MPPMQLRRANGKRLESDGRKVTALSHSEQALSIFSMNVVLQSSSKCSLPPKNCCWTCLRRQNFSCRRRPGRHCGNAPPQREKYSCQRCRCSAWPAAAFLPISVLLPSPPSWSAVVVVSVSVCGWFVAFTFLLDRD